ncbi:hypothetical protein BH09ACT10_BH09ACT10_16260 [soil metagenome]
MTTLPRTVTAAEREAAETTLVADAPSLTLKDLSRRALRIADVFAEPPVVDQIEGDALVARDKAARRKTTFWMLDQGDGTVKGGFVIPEAYADMLRTPLEAISAPRRDALKHGAPGNELGSVDDGNGDSTRTYPEKMGHAFLELIGHIPADRLPTSGGVGPTVTVNLDYTQLVSGIGAATLSTGTRIPVEQARMMACNHHILPMVFAGKPFPLELGHDARLFSRAQRIALAARDGGCAFPGCDRPPPWCEGHHAKNPWAQGGETNIDEGVLLCARHHHTIHHHGWTVHLDHHNQPWFTPPASVDPQRKPRQNSRWKPPHPTTG